MNNKYENEEDIKITYNMILLPRLFCVELTMISFKMVVMSSLFMLFM